MANDRLIIDAETVITSLMFVENRTYLPIPYMQKFVGYVYNNLQDPKIFGNVNVIFDISYDTIERTVLYNNNIFDLVGDTIYLKTSIDEIKDKYTIIDGKLKNIIGDFCAAAA